MFFWNSLAFFFLFVKCGILLRWQLRRHLIEKGMNCQGGWCASSTVSSEECGGREGQRPLGSGKWDHGKDFAFDPEWGVAQACCVLRITLGTVWRTVCVGWGCTPARETQRAGCGWRSELGVVSIWLFKSLGLLEFSWVVWEGRALPRRGLWHL